MSLKVNEIFYSIQGESTFSGIPCIFIRLSECNLRCSYCDTKYAYNEGREYTIDALVESVSIYKCNLVEVTGGEPLYQIETPALIDRLLGRGYKVLLETNGSFDIRCVNHQCIKIVDIKCPSSKESEKMDLKNPQRLGPLDQVKFVIGDRGDYEYAKKIIKLHCTGISGERLLFSTAENVLSPSELASWILQDSLDVRMQLQMHKILWQNKKRGV